MLSPVNDQGSDAEQRLLRLLKIPPQPRPKWERAGELSPKHDKKSNRGMAGRYMQAK
jgi:hypothetical protein